MLKTVTPQLRHWQGKFGREYTDRHVFTLEQMNKRYKHRYGVTGTELSEEFLGSFDRSIKILEVGSNVGNKLLLLQKMGFKNLYGIEINSYAVQRSKAGTDGINIICGSAFDIPFKDGFFDLVFTFGVLIHIAPSDIQKALSEIYRCTNDYIWGFEYYSDAYTEVTYREHEELLWKTDFAKLYLDSFDDLELIKEKRVKYLKDENIDTMFLVRKCNTRKQLMEKATSSTKLINRADSNKAYAENDFNQWTGSLLNELSFSSVLDVCCGNGNQLMLYGTKPEVVTIVGVDVSEHALEAAKKRLEEAGAFGRTTLKAMKMEDMFSDSELTNSRFDLISCFYGLYYSEDTAKLLHEMVEHLSGNGTILVVGPYGKNNEALFSLLERHFKLPELVVRSSMTFMEDEVCSGLAECLDVEKKTFVNKICYPSAKALIDYWKASTFYFPEYEAAVTSDIEKHFEKHKNFVVEKHILACIARPKG